MTRASNPRLPFTFTDRHGTQLFAATATGLRLAFDLSRLDGRDGNIAFQSLTDPAYGVIDQVSVAFAGTPVKWFYHQPPPALGKAA